MISLAQINNQTGGILPGEKASKPGGGGASTSVEGSTYAFIAGWILLIAILAMVNRTRLGHVIIYYSLLLMILFILVVEYQQITPLLAGATSIGQLNQ